MKKLLLVIFLFVSLVVLNSCKEFGEVNLSKATITILAPANKDSLTNSNVTFWWEPVTGALKYNIEIVKPSFTNVQTLFIDSNVTTNKFTFALNPGNYQWRIQAINGSSNSAYFTQSFFLDSSLNLITSTVQLSSPANGYTTSNHTVSLQWLALSAATTYNLEVEKTGINPVIITGITTPSYQYVFPSYGTYQWKVWAENSNSQSIASSLNTIIISIPYPTSQLPSDRDTNQVVPVILSWNRGSNQLNSSTNASDSILIYTDSTENNLVKNDFSYTKTYTFTPASPPSKQWYYWKVKTIDSLSDQSIFTSIKRFRLKT